MNYHGKRRALGQHFLKNSAVAEAIAEAAVQEAFRNSCPLLMEIGPGHGAITGPIFKKLPHHSTIQKFLLVERDFALADKWQKFPAPFPTEVISGDFLEVPEEKWLAVSPIAVVSNLPYSAGTAILNRLARKIEKIPVMVLMFQAEVAQRIRAEPETKGRGSLSIWIQNYWDVKKLISVPPGAFSPPPKVNSEVILLNRRANPRIHLEPHTSDEKLWETLLRDCFAQRRKMLRTMPRWRNALEHSGLDGTKRAEALQWDEWDSLFQAARKVSTPPST